MSYREREPLKSPVKARQIKHSRDQLLPVKITGQQRNYHPNSVIYQIRTEKIVGYKIGGRWYVVPGTERRPL